MKRFLFGLAICFVFTNSVLADIWYEDNPWGDVPVGLQCHDFYLSIVSDKNSNSYTSYGARRGEAVICRGSFSTYDYERNVPIKPWLPSPLSLPSDFLGDSIAIIADKAFDDLNHDGYAITSIIVPGCVRKIGNRVFCNTKLSSVSLASGVQSIGEYSFAYCYSLNSVDLPNTLTNISSYLFYYCLALPAISIPSSVQSIGNCAFYKCSSLRSISIPGNVKTVGASAFYECSKLSSVTISSGVTSIGAGAFTHARP